MTSPISTRPAPPVFLALDTGSPMVTVAAGNRESHVEVQVAVGESSSRLLDAVGDCLQQLAVQPKHLAGLLCTSGPGSFTGLRIGMATILGLNASLAVPAVALPTLWVQAASVPTAPSTASVLAAVATAHRGQYYVQPFDASTARSRGPIATVSDLGPHLDALSSPTVRIVVASTTDLGDQQDLGEEVSECGPLAVCLLHLATRQSTQEADLFDWNVASLTKPLYAHTPAVSARPRVVSASSRSG